MIYEDLGTNKTLLHFYGNHIIFHRIISIYIVFLPLYLTVVLPIRTRAT
jgi:hypothetical protein